MIVSMFILFGLVAVLLLLLGWALRGPGKLAKSAVPPDAFDESAGDHITFLPQIRQALAKADFDFLRERASEKLQRRVRRERRDVALAYLAAVRGDFNSLLRMARVIAVLSPEVAAVQEFERFRLTAKFNWQYQLIRWKLLAGFAILPQLDGLGNLVSGLSVRMEEAMKELGERAALAAELASSLNRRGLGTV
jgi:hypothetical protein